MTVSSIARTLAFLLMGLVSAIQVNSQTTVFSENFDGVVQPYTVGATYTNANCSNFIVATNLDPMVCNFLGYPLSPDASGSGKFLFHGTVDGVGAIYNDTVYSTTVNTTLLAGVAYTIQFDVALANNIAPPLLEASLNTVSLGAAFTPGSVNSWQTISYTYTPSSDLANPVFTLYNYQATGFGNDFGIDDIKISFTQLSGLPVHFPDFSAQAAKQHVILQWSTDAETANDYFSIERSADKLTYFSIGEIKGAGYSNSIKKYSFEDTKPLPGTGYYRLRQAGNNGVVMYSKTVAVRIAADNMNITIYPNPVTKDFIVSLKNYDAQPCVVSVTDLRGKTVFSKEAAARAGQIAVQLNNRIQPGIYIIRVKGNGQEAISKIVIR